MYSATRNCCTSYQTAHKSARCAIVIPKASWRGPTLTPSSRRRLPRAATSEHTRRQTASARGHGANVCLSRRARPSTGCPATTSEAGSPPAAEAPACSTGRAARGKSEKCSGELVCSHAAGLCPLLPWTSRYGLCRTARKGEGFTAQGFTFYRACSSSALLQAACTSAAATARVRAARAGMLLLVDHQEMARTTQMLYCQKPR